MFSVIDIESTGGGYKAEKIIDIAIYLYNGNQITKSFSSLVNPGIPIPTFVKKLTGITDQMVAKAPRFEEIAPAIAEITKGSVFVAHNAQYDYSIVKQEFKRMGRSFKREKLCTIQAAQKIYPNLPSYGLDSLCEDFDISVTGRHRASGDAQATVALLGKLIKKDVKEIIPILISQPHILENFAPNISFKDVYSLPEDTGVYYLHDANGKVILLGKSNTMRERVLQFLLKEPVNKDKKNLFNEVHSVSYALTGSEILALLVESNDLGKGYPEFNKKLRLNSFQPIGIIAKENKEGYKQLKVGKVTPKDDALMFFERSNQANLQLRKMVKRYKLCPEFCGLNQNKCHCKGNCVTRKESPEAYNKKVAKIQPEFDMKGKSFLIKSEGRYHDELSLIGIIDGRFWGYGFFDRSVPLDNPNSLVEQLDEMPQSPEADIILQTYLAKIKPENILPLK